MNVNKKLAETDRFIVITWPDIQYFMTKDDFEDNSCLICNDIFLEQYGSSCYFVRESWANQFMRKV